MYVGSLTFSILVLVVKKQPPSRKYIVFFLLVVTQLTYPEYVERIQREAGELQSIFSSPRTPPPSYESDLTEESQASTDYSSPVRSEHQHFRTNIKSMPYLALK